MQNTEVMTPIEAQLWLANLEKDCQYCWNEYGGHRSDCTKCNGTGKAPVLDLREPCSNYGYSKDEKVEYSI